jgi:peptidoglycan L-alanyl-D-glutamate endopeptidase CwlK
VLNQSSVKRLLEVYTGLAQKIIKLDSLIPSVNLQVSQGLRTWADQDALYAKGRTEPGEIVTNAPGGYSWHEFGLAVDVFPADVISGAPDWNPSHPSWAKIIEAAPSLNLVSGSCWKYCPDYPHLQYTGIFPVTPTDEARELFKQGGLQAVWNAAFNSIQAT